VAKSNGDAPGRRRKSAQQLHGAVMAVSNNVNACVLIIGNEILSGRTQDTNLQHIALQLNARGIRVMEARVIPDIEAVIIANVRDASARFDYVFTTGGIGPTHDDITAESIARAFDRPLVEEPRIAERIRSRPAPSDDIMKARLRMARVPQGATLIDNPTGGPEGFCIGNVYVMAGIPRVMQGMLSTVLDSLHGGDPILSKAVTVYLGESQIAGPLGEIQTRYPAVDIGSYPFARDGRYGTTLVMRSTDAAALDVVKAELVRAIEAAGGQAHDAT
jgi:molybdenum cofactor synthesis domain-containing protein